MKIIVLPKHQRLIELLGENIKLARLRRKLTVTQMRERAGISVADYKKVEEGNSDLPIGVYTNVLFVLGLENEIPKIGFDDPVGRKIQDVNLLAGQRDVES